MTARCAARPRPRPVGAGDPGGALRADLPLHRLRERSCARCGTPAEAGTRTVMTSSSTTTARFGHGHAPQGGRPVPPRPRPLRRRRRAARDAARRDPAQPACARPDPVGGHQRRRVAPQGPRRAHGAALAERGMAWMPTPSHDTAAVLATDKVRYQGQEVAFVVAEDRYAARDALALIDVDYEPLPPVVDARRALEPGTPRRARRRPRPPRQPRLRLGDRRRRGDRRGVRRRRARVGLRPALPARASGAAGDLWRGGERRPGEAASSRCTRRRRPRTRTAWCTP